MATGKEETEGLEEEETVATETSTKFQEGVTEDEDELLDYDVEEEENQADITGDTKAEDVKDSPWLELNLKPELLKAIEMAGFTSLSEAQQECIPRAIQGMDILCQARGGLGKTTAFIIATLEQLVPVEDRVSVVVVAHGRELAFGISKEYERLSKYMDNIKVAAFFGGIPIKRDEEVLKKKCPNIAVCTPGRLEALCKGKTIILDHVKHFILDECDYPLRDIDTRRVVQDVFKLMPREKQVLMTTYSLSEEIRPLCKKFMQDPYCFPTESTSSAH